MKVLLIVLAVLVIIGWGIGCFRYQAGGFIHLTLAVAILALLLQLVPRAEK